MHMTDTHAAPAAMPLNPLHGRVCSAANPFARLEIGRNVYEVAQALTEADMLAFRSEGHRTWTALDRRVADGWGRIAADIVLADPDSLYDFLYTHAVRIPADGPSSSVMEFDTLGTRWTVRPLAQGQCKIAFSGAEPVLVDLGKSSPVNSREPAILALLKSDLDVRGHFDEALSHWAERIATGVQVQPIM